MYCKFITIILLLISTTVFSQTTTTFSGSTVTEDSWMNLSATGTNYGSADTVKIENGFTAFTTGALKVLSINDSIPTTATVTHCSLRVYINFVDGSQSIESRRLCKTWVESQITWDDWKTSTAWQFGGATGAGSNCTSCDNSGNGSGDDYIGTKTSSASFNSTGWVAIPIDTCHANAWVSGSDVNNGITTFPVTGFQGCSFSSSEAGSNQPEFVFVWTAPAGGVPNARHSADGIPVRHSADGASSRHGGN